MNKFKDSLNRFITQGLFIELTTDTETAIYTLSDEDKVIKGKKYKSLKAEFLLFSDPSGYHFAIEYFYNYAHYKRLLGNTSVKKVIDEWTEELELKLQADALLQMVKHSHGEKGQASAKWLAEQGWKKKSRAGRPSKAQVAAEVKRKTALGRLVEEDLVRIEQQSIN